LRKLVKILILVLLVGGSNEASAGDVEILRAVIKKPKEVLQVFNDLKVSADPQGNKSVVDLVDQVKYGLWCSKKLCTFDIPTNSEYPGVLWDGELRNKLFAVLPEKAAPQTVGPDMINRTRSTLVIQCISLEHENGLPYQNGVICTTNGAKFKKAYKAQIN